MAVNIRTKEKLEIVCADRDFEELVRNGIDAVELTNCGAFRDSLDIWDCNCILVMNPEIIVPE